MSSNAGACSIHLGNYIIEIAPNAVQQANIQREREASQSPSRPGTAKGSPVSKHKHTSSNQLANQGFTVTPVALHTQSSGSALASTADMSSNGRGALQFELQWLKFLRDAEEDYITRLIRNDKQSALSVFEVNVDVFETYLLRVSGRALAATQHLNLNLTSSLHSDMRIFDTQQEHVPYEVLLKEEAQERIYQRKERRMRRRMRNRRGTATFGGADQEIAQELQPKVVFNESPMKTPQAQNQHSLFVLHPIAEEHSQLQLSSDQIEDSPSQNQPLRLNSQLNAPEPLKMLDSLNERDGAEEGQDDFIQEDNEDGDFDRAGAGAIHDIIVHKPPEEQHQQTIVFGHSRDFDDSMPIPNISPIHTANVTKVPSMITPPPEVAQDFAHNEDTKQQTLNDGPSLESGIKKHLNDEQDSSQPRIDLQANDGESVPAHAAQSSDDLIRAKLEMAQSHIEQSVEIHQDIALHQKPQHPVAVSNNFDALNKIKIGEHTIGDPYQSVGDTSIPNNLTANQDANLDPLPHTGVDQADVQQNHTFELGEQYTINDVTDLDNTNPFREKSVVSYVPGLMMAQNQPDPALRDEASFGGENSSQPAQSGEQPMNSLNQDQQHSNPEYGNTFEKKVNSLDQLVSQDSQEVLTQQEHAIQRQGTGPLSGHDKTNDSLQMTSVAQVIKVESPRSQAYSNNLNYTTQHQQPSHILEDHQPTRLDEKSLEQATLLSECNPPSLTAGKEFRSAQNTPLNVTLEEIPKTQAAVETSQIVQKSPERVDAAVGNSQISIDKNQHKDQSVLASQTNANVGTSALNISRVDEGQSVISRNQNISKVGTFSPRIANKSMNISREMVSATVSAQDQSLINTQGYQLPPIVQQQHPQQPEKLQITLTAEPDKPIMVEVRGGEKEFVISALTQHLFDILSKPKGLTLMPQIDSNSSCVERQSEDQEQITSPEQLGQLDSKGVFTLNNQAVNTKVKQLKKQLKKEGVLPSVQRNQARQSGALFDSATRQEMYSGMPVISKNSNGQMTIEENSLSKRDLPEIKNQNANQQTGGDSAFIKINTNNWRSKGSSRSSHSGIVLSPLTTSNIDEVKHDPAGHTRHLSKEEQLIYERALIEANTKRTTQEVQVSAKINEEQHQHTYTESDLISAKVGHVSALGSIPNTMRREEGNISSPEKQGKIPSKESSHQKAIIQNIPHQTEESFRKVSSEEALQILQQQSMQRSQDSIHTPNSGTGTMRQIHKSRPETANFNKAFAASQDGELAPPTVADQAKHIQQMEEDLEHARQRLSMMIRHENDAHAMFQGEPSPIANNEDPEGNDAAVIQAPETPKYKGEDDISIADQQAHVASRLETPGADAHDGVHIQEIVNSAPAQLEEVNLAPIHPTIPQAHPNGYFSTESDYMMIRPESNTRLRQSNSSEANDQYLKHPKLNYYENQNLNGLQPNIQPTQQTTVTDTFFNSQYGFSDQDQQMVEGDFILAEGYPILNYMQDSRNGIMGPPQYYDFSQTSFTPILASSPGVGMGGSMQTTPNAYRIRKVILPNYPNNNSSLSYNGHHENTTGVSPASNLGLTNNTSAALYPPSHLQSRDASQNKQLPVVKTRKRYFQTTMQNPTNGMNPLIVLQNGDGQDGKKGGSKNNGMQFQGHRSLSPVRVSQKKVYYTTSYMTKKQLLQQLQQEQWLRQQQQSMVAPQLNSTGQLSVDDFNQFAYYSQSPQPRMKASPYMSDDEFKILHDFYNISCEPTGMQRGGLPLMKVKRIYKPKNKNFNAFNFSEDPQNLSLPKALSSLQIFYPQFQPNHNEILSKTLNTPSKWFERFNQSTRNLNHTIQNMHKEHSRKLRSYSISSLSSTVGAVPGGAVSDTLRQRSGSQQALFVKRQTPGAAMPGFVENGEFDGINPQREHTSLPQDIILTNISHDLGQTKVNGLGNSRKFFSSTKDAANNSTYMPPLKKIYTQTKKDDHNREKYARTTGGTQKKGTKLPPKPSKQKGVPISSSSGANQGTTGKQIPLGAVGSGKKDRSLSASQKQVLQNSMNPPHADQQQPVIQLPPNSIIYANHNQQVCFGVNIITKSDK